MESKKFKVIQDKEKQWDVIETVAGVYLWNFHTGAIRPIENSDESISSLSKKWKRREGIKYASLGSANTLKKAQKPTGFLRFCRLFSFVLSHKIRNEVFEPMFSELEIDYLSSRKKYRTKLARRWLKFAFTCRFVVMVFQCVLAALPDRILKWGKFVLTLLVR